jgi:hypothetical protein
MCCEEMKAALDDDDSGFSVISDESGKRLIHMALGNSSYINFSICLWCEKEILQQQLDEYMRERNIGA